MARLLHGDFQWELHIRLFPSQAPVSAPQGIIQLLWGEAVPWRIPWDDYSWAFSLQFPLKLLELWPHECEGAQGSSRGGCNPTEIPFFHELGTFPDPFIFWSEFFTLGDCFAWMSWTQSLQAAEFRDGEGTQRILRKKKKQIIVIGANQLQIQLFQMERNLFQQSCEPENPGANSHHDSKVFHYRYCKGTPNTPGSDPAVLHTWIPQLKSLRSNPGLGQQEMNPTAASWDGNCSGSLWGVQSWEWAGIHWIPRISQAESWNFHPEQGRNPGVGSGIQEMALRWKSMGILEVEIHGNPCFPGRVLRSLWRWQKCCCLSRAALAPEVLWISHCPGSAHNQNPNRLFLILFLNSSQRQD